MATPLRLLTVIGARPQIIKAAALSRAIREQFDGRIKETILHTGQHYDANMSGVFFGELGIPEPEVQLGVGSGTQGATTARMVEGIEAVLLRKAHDVLVIYGDTNSTLAGALAAAKLHVPIAHIEAGLRSFNKAMPEEVNRIVADHCSTWLFCPTTTAVINLDREGFSLNTDHPATMDKPHVVNSGDVMLDNALHFSGIKKNSSILDGIGPTGTEFMLVTVHRQNNTDDVQRLNAIFGALMELRQRTKMPVLLPVHPRTQQRMNDLLDPSLARAVEQDQGLRLIPPVGYLDMLELERNARVVITDSGGVQKEASFFAKPCVILRSETEWVELVEQGHGELVDADPERLFGAVDRALAAKACSTPKVFGDGNAALHICEHLIRTR